MRITIVNQFYPPDFAPTGRLAKSLAEHRAVLGDRVTIITSTGGYVPQSPISSHKHSSNPIIRQIWTPRLGKDHFLGRLIDYAFYYIGALFHLLILPEQDLIISLTTPPLIAWTGVFHSWIHPNTRILVWNMDCYPEIAESAGVIKTGGRISRFLRWLNRRLFRSIDGIVCLDQAMCTLLQRRYEPTTSSIRWSVIPNWEPLERFPSSINEHWSVLNEFDLDDAFIVLYMGNAGEGHSFETILSAAQQLAGEAISFIFVGGGSKWPALHAAVINGSVSNVHLLNYIPDDQVLPALHSASCALITLQEDALGAISPSKLHAYLAMSLPVIYLGPAGSNVDDAIRHFNAGISLRHGDVQGVVDFIHHLRNNSELHRTYRLRAREAFETAYSDRAGLEAFDTFIASIFSKGR